MSTQGPPKSTDTVSPEKCIADMVFEAIKVELEQFTLNLESLRERMDGFKLGLDELQEGMDVAYDRLAQLECTSLELQKSCHMSKINLPEVYDGKSKALADQFTHQVEAVAEFENFCDECQKILWAQSYLTRSAQDWSCVIMTGAANPKLNPCQFEWTMCLMDFKAAFCMWNPVQDALTWIRQLQPGFKVDYGLLERKGLNSAAMEALVNTNYKTVEEAWNILLHRESKLVDIAAKKKGGWHANSVTHASVSALLVSTSTSVPARSVLPTAPADPNAMDVDYKETSSLWGHVHPSSA
ncbi:hypothetical protein C0995_002232 [Termitomyces sp. Mi166|nr:hypothetical protein C0995_002232 [Termitomyces sp. Mi166\